MICPSPPSPNNVHMIEWKTITVAVVCRPAQSVYFSRIQQKLVNYVHVCVYASTFPKHRHVPKTLSWKTRCGAAQTHSRQKFLSHENSIHTNHLINFTRSEGKKLRPPEIVFCLHVNEEKIRLKNAIHWPVAWRRRAFNFSSHRHGDWNGSSTALPRAGSLRAGRWTCCNLPTSVLLVRQL